MVITGGYFLKSRSIQKSKIAHAPPHIREIWDWLLLNTNHSDTDVCKRGQTIRTYKDIIDDLAWYVGWRKETYSKWDCEKAMKWLKKEGMITTTKTTRGMLIEVVNYSHYQNPQNYENHNENITKATREPQSSHTINKNDNNDKNDKNINTMASPEIKNTFSVSDILNKKTGISNAWQDKAFRYATALKIELKDPALKSRWLKFFKFSNNAKIDTTYSYLSDYPPFNNLPNCEAKVKYFFWYYNNK